jgi:hypothetical protein
MMVLVVSDGVAEARPISIGYDDGIWAEVLSGLDGTEAVITATSGAITAGSPVVAVHAGS